MLVISTSVVDTVEHKTYSNILHHRLYKGIQLDRFGLLLGHRFGLHLFGWGKGLHRKHAFQSHILRMTMICFCAERSMRITFFFFCFCFEYSPHLHRHEHLDQQWLFEVNCLLTSLHLLCSGSWSMRAVFLLNETKSEDCSSCPRSTPRPLAGVWVAGVE